MDLRKDNSKRIEAIEAFCNEKEREISTLVSSIEHGESLLRELSDPTILAHIKRGTAREIDRLAKAGMAIGIDDRDERLKLHGQYAGVVLYGASPEMTQEILDENKGKLAKARASLADKRNQLLKLKE